MQRTLDFPLQHNITADNYVLTNEQRWDVFHIWKDKYNGTALQKNLQTHDFWSCLIKAMAKAKVVLLIVPVKVKIMLLSMP